MVGDVGAPTGQVPLYSGNDVLDGGDQGDKMVGFSGDDIMLGLGGFDKFYGRLGFDWASWENETHGVSVDMERREFIPDQLAPAGDAVRDFFIETEAASGSAFADVLRGTDVARVDTFNELINVNLIFGLAEFFPEGPVAFSDGNIMLGGGGGDFIEGRGGNDIIDGDAYLHVELTRDANGNASSPVARSSARSCSISLPVTSTPPCSPATLLTTRSTSLRMLRVSLPSPTTSAPMAPIGCAISSGCNSRT